MSNQNRKLITFQDFHDSQQGLPKAASFVKYTDAMIGIKNDFNKILGGHSNFIPIKNAMGNTFTRDTRGSTASLQSRRKLQALP